MRAPCGKIPLKSLFTGIREILKLASLLSSLSKGPWKDCSKDEHLSGILIAPNQNLSKNAYGSKDRA